MQPDIILPNSTPPPLEADSDVQNAYGMMSPVVSPMDSQNSNFAQTSDIIPPISGSAEMQPNPATPPAQPPKPRSDSVIGRLRAYITAHRLQMVVGTILFIFVAGNLGMSIWLYSRVNNYSALSAVGLKKSSTNSSTFNGDDTLYINTKNKGVGVGAPSPDGLQVDSSVTGTSQSTANIRLGLLDGEPDVLLEGKDATQWEFGISSGSLQLGQLGTPIIQLDKNGFTALGNSTLGSSGTNTVTLQASTLAIPNNLNIGNNALYVDSAHGSIAVGASSAAGYKLLVAGTFKANGSVQSGGQIIGVAGSASQPSITFSGNTNTGIFSPGGNITSVSAGGSETLRVQPGTVSVLNGANLSVNGYLTSGAASPAWQIIRLTGTLNGVGSDTVAHGISNASSRVIMAMAWYQSGGEAKPLSVDYVDGTNIQIDGGPPGAAWRGMIMYTADTAGW